MRCEVAKRPFCSEEVPPSHKATEDKGKINIQLRQ